MLAPDRGNEPSGNFGLDALRAEIVAWSADINTRQRGVEWQMKVADARCKLKSVYPKIILAQTTSFRENLGLPRYRFEASAVRLLPRDQGVPPSLL